MKKLLEWIRSLNVFLKILAFILITALLIFLVIVLKPAESDPVQETNGNQAWWVLMSFVIGFIAYLFFHGKKK
jgi:uncharacterized membrane protein YfcA